VNVCERVCVYECVCVSACVYVCVCHLCVYVCVSMCESVCVSVSVSVCVSKPHQNTASDCKHLSRVHEKYECLNPPAHVACKRVSVCAGASRQLSLEATHRARPARNGLVCAPCKHMCKTHARVCAKSRFRLEATHGAWPARNGLVCAS